MAGYGDDAGFTAYAAAAGYTVPAGSIPGARQRGSIYIDGTYGARFPGQPTGGVEQERAWPRIGATVYGVTLASDLIPQRVIDASYEAAYQELNKPGSLSVSFDPARKVKRQKAEGIEREFFDAGDSSNVWAPNAPISSIIDGLLAPLIGPIWGEPAIMVV